MSTADPPPGARPDRDTGPEPPPPIRLLRRSVTDRKLAGVCGGAGRWLDIDPLVLRVAVAVLAVFGGAGILLYGLAWLLVPEDDAEASEGQRLLRGQPSASAVTAIVVVIVGMSVFGGVLGGGPDLGGLVLLAVLGIAVAVAVRQGRATRPDVFGVPSAAAPGPAAGPPYDGTAYSVPAPPAAGGAESPTPGADPFGRRPGAAYSPPPPPPPTAPTAPPREPSVLGLLTVSLAVLVAGALLAWGLWTGDGPGLPVIVAIALAVVGVGLVVGTVVGRARGLIAVGIVLSLVLVSTASYDVPVRGGVGERVWAPESVAEVESPYRLGVGEARLDLTGVDPAGTLDVDASLAMGHLVVLVPPDVDLRVRADVGIGEIDLPDGRESSGLGPQRRWTGEAAGISRGLMVLDLELGVGQLEVRREAA